MALEARFVCLVVVILALASTVYCTRNGGRHVYAGLLKLFFYFQILFLFFNSIKRRLPFEVEDLRKKNSFGNQYFPYKVKSN